jgi:hypothetical protein
VRLAAGFALALVLAACTVVSGKCEREITVKTRCEAGGTVIVLPQP